VLKDKNLYFFLSIDIYYLFIHTLSRGKLSIYKEPMSRPQRASNVGMGWDGNEDDYGMHNGQQETAPPLRTNKQRSTSRTEGGGFFQRTFGREQNSRSEVRGDRDEEDWDEERPSARTGGGADGNAASRMQSIADRSSGSKYSSVRDKRGRHWGRCLAIIMALTIIAGVAVGAYMAKYRSDQDEARKEEDAAVVQDIIDNRTEKPTGAPTSVPISAPPTPPGVSSTILVEAPTVAPAKEEKTALAVPDCDEGLVAHRISLEGAADNSDASLWKTSSGQIRTLVLQIRDAEWGDLIYQKGFRSPDEYDYTCLNVNDAMQELSFQSGCYDVSVSWFIPGVGVEMDVDGDVRWKIEPVEQFFASTAVSLGIVPYSQDRTTTCTIMTSIEEGFFQCLPNCAQAP